VQEFNRGIFDYLVATDDPAKRAEAHAQQEAAAAAAAAAAERAPAAEPDGSAAAAAAGKKRKKGAKGAQEQQQAQQQRKRRRAEPDAEFGVIRGVDFKGVRSVINVDAPDSVPVRIHFCFVRLPLQALLQCAWTQGSLGTPYCHGT
jgi:ATP-dependent RNA helicase DDX56/DBP9